MRKKFAIFVLAFLLVSCASPTPQPTATPLPSPTLTAAPTSTEIPKPTPSAPAGDEPGGEGFVEGAPLPDSPLITPAHEPILVSGTVNGAILNFEVVLDKHVTENQRVQLDRIMLNPDKDPQKLLDAQAQAMYDTYRHGGGTRWGSVGAYMRAIAEFQAGLRPEEDVSFKAVADANFEDGDYRLEDLIFVPTADFVWRVVPLDERYVSGEIIPNVGAGNKNQDGLGIGVHKNESGHIEVWVDWIPRQDFNLRGISVSVIIANGLIAPSMDIPGWDMSDSREDDYALHNSWLTSVGKLLVSDDGTSAFITSPMSPDDPNGN